MLKLKSASAEPFWLEILPGQRTQFRPVTMAMILVARHESGKAVVAALPDFAPGGVQVAEADGLMATAAGRVRFAATLCELGIVAWEGVGDAEGNELTPTKEAIAFYVSDWRVYDAIQTLYVDPALASIEEKNASAPSQNGTSGAKTQAKATASIARRNAKHVRTP